MLLKNKKFLNEIMYNIKGNMVATLYHEYYKTLGMFNSKDTLSSSYFEQRLSYSCCMY